jgi:hypothetical protein
MNVPIIARTRRFNLGVVERHVRRLNTLHRQRISMMLGDGIGRAGDTRMTVRRHAVNVCVRRGVMRMPMTQLDPWKAREQHKPRQSQFQPKAIG